MIIRVSVLPDYKTSHVYDTRGVTPKYVNDFIIMMLDGLGWCSSHVADVVVYHNDIEIDRYSLLLDGFYRIEWFDNTAYWWVKHT